MSTNPVDFSDLDDTSITDAPSRTTDREAPATVFECRPVSKRSTPAKAEGARFPCGKCHGTGTYVFGYVHRQSGKCHACNGRGYFATSPAQRAEQRAKASSRREAQAKLRDEKRRAFLTARPDVAEWLRQGCARQDSFATSLSEKLSTYGELTTGQLIAVEDSIARQKRWAEERAAKDAQVAADPNALRLTLPAGLYAVPDGETRLKVRIDRPASGKWAGFVFVKNGAEYGPGADARYGMQRPAGAYVGKITEQLRVINADPREAMAAYGRITGTCGRCGRKLEDQDSIDAGIGPVCAAKDWSV